MEKIDFAIIGAQKSGTTALYHYLNLHPEVSLPVNKEAVYFLDGKDDATFEDFYDKYYSHKSTECKVGSISPQYMCYTELPEELFKHNSKVKIVAVLREPIARAYSHYKMNVRREYLDYDFEEVVNQQARGEINLPTNREHDESKYELENVISWGMYGKIINGFEELFGRENILIVNYDELISNPLDVYLNICKHIDVDRKFVPDNLGKRYHEGGTKTLLPRASYFARISIFKKIWHIFPIKTRQRLGYWYETNNIRKSKGDSFDFRKYDELVEIYCRDLEDSDLTKDLAEKWYRK